MPQPTQIVLITDVIAHEMGYYNVCSRGKYEYYNLIIKDSSAREIWLRLFREDNVNIYKQKELIQILSECGLIVDPKSLSVFNLGVWDNENVLLRYYRKKFKLREVELVENAITNHNSIDSLETKIILKESLDLLTKNQITIHVTLSTELNNLSFL